MPALQAVLNERDAVIEKYDCYCRYVEEAGVDDEAEVIVNEIDDQVSHSVCCACCV